MHTGPPTAAPQGFCRHEHIHTSPQILRLDPYAPLTSFARSLADTLEPVITAASKLGIPHVS
jgi:hypothetical protein